MQSYQKWIWQDAGWPEMRFSDQALAPVMARFQQSSGELIGRAHALGFDGITPAVAEAWIAEAISTSAIEGEGLNPNSVRSSVARRLGLELSNGSPAARNIEGLLDLIADASNNFEAPLTLDRLCSWHSALFPTGLSGMHRIDVGVMRTSEESMQIVSGPIGRQKVHFQAPAAKDLPKEMDRFLQWLNGSRSQGIARVAIAHLWFETIHPFDDGNGRIGRAIIQLCLAQEVGPVAKLMTLARQLELERNAYYLQLEAAQKAVNLDVTPWVQWFLNQVEHACNHANLVIDSSLQRMRFLAQTAEVPLNDRQRKILKKLLDAGPGGFKGGMTTRKYASVCEVHKITAARDLINLAELGVLKSEGAGRSTRYYPNIDGWEELFVENEGASDATSDAPSA